MNRKKIVRIKNSLLNNKRGFLLNLTYQLPFKNLLNSDNNDINIILKGIEHNLEMKEKLNLVMTLFTMKRTTIDFSSTFKSFISRFLITLLK